jgi:hypothetical protein
VSNGSGLLQQLISVSGGQIQGTAVLSAFGTGIDLFSKLVPPVGTATGLVEGILNLVDPPASAPTTRDLQNEIAAFANTVVQKLEALQATVAGGQLKDNAQALEAVLTGPNGSLSIVGEIPGWKNSPGLPLPETFTPQNYQIFARSALLTLLGGGPGALPPDTRPTAYWWLPVGDLPLFKPENAWTYYGTSSMFNKPDPQSAEGIPLGDLNPFTSGAPSQFDLSAFRFTNQFEPAQVDGIPGANAFNPTWVLQQSMAAVYYYLLICGAVLENFPNDGATIPDFVGDNNFAGNLLWYHDQIRAGIVNISPPYWLDLITQTENGLIAASADAGVSQWEVPSEPSQIVGDFGFSAASAPASEWSRPFGALCSYTGYVAGAGGSQPSVDRYPSYVYPSAGEPVYIAPQDVQPRAAGSQWYNGFYGKYLVACLWRTKLVYLGMGLDHMWHTINNLYAMCGKAPQPGPCFGDWSLREVFRMLGSANMATFPLPAQSPPILGINPDTGLPNTTKLTVLAFFQFMNGAAPTPSRPLTSLRAILQA